MGMVASWLTRVNAWWNARKPKRLDELVAVEFDEQEVRVIGLAPNQAGWNQRFRWRDITRVCFKDEGLYSSDLIVIALGAAGKTVIVPIEARGGSALFGALTEKDYFPEPVWRRAMQETGGNMHCWPPQDA